jgi:hypothetical protein
MLILFIYLILHDIELLSLPQSLSILRFCYICRQSSEAAPEATPEVTPETAAATSYAPHRSYLKNAVVTTTAQGGRSSNSAWFSSDAPTSTPLS